MLQCDLFSLPGFSGLDYLAWFGDWSSGLKHRVILKSDSTNTKRLSQLPPSNINVFLVPTVGYQ